MISPRHNISFKNYQDVHYWLRKNFGRATRCDGENCKKVSFKFNWALRKGEKYKKNIKNFIQLCRSCHAILDTTDETREKISQRQQGCKRSKAFRNRISEIMKERKLNGWKQYPNGMPEEVRAKLSRAHSGKKRDTPQLQTRKVVEKRMKTMRDKYFSNPEYIKKLSEVRKKVYILKRANKPYQ